MFATTRTFFAITLLFCVLNCSSNEKNNPLNDFPDEEPALIQLSQAIEDTPEDASLYAERGYLYYEREGYDEAISDLNQALKIDSTNLEYLHLLADVYLDYYKSRLALETMEKAVTLHPESTLSKLKLSEFQLILKKHDGALQTLNNLLATDPVNAEAFFMIGQVYKDQEKYKSAIPYFQEAVENDPDLIDGWINLGQLYHALGNEKALQYFNTAIRIAPDNIQAYHSKANFLSDKERLPEALQVYNTINRIDPQYEEAFFNAGLLYLDLDSLEQAFDRFTITTSIDPVHVKAYYYRGVSAELNGQLDVAKENYEQALKLNPDYGKAQEALYDVAQKLNAVK